MEASIIIDRAENAPYLPLSALFRDEGKWSVFKVVDGVTQLRQVGVGRINDRIAEITEGLNEGDQIITHPGSNVFDDVRVKQR